MSELIDLKRIRVQAPRSSEIVSWPEVSPMSSLLDGRQRLELKGPHWQVSPTFYFSAGLQAV